MDEWSKAPPHSPHEEMAAEEVRVWISAEYIRFFDHFWRCVYRYKSRHKLRVSNFQYHKKYLSRYLYEIPAKLSIMSYDNVLFYLMFNLSKKYNTYTTYPYSYTY